MNQSITLPTYIKNANYAPRDLYVQMVLWINNHYEYLDRETLFEIYHDENAYFIRITPYIDNLLFNSLLARLSVGNNSFQGFTYAEKPEVFKSKNGQRILVYVKDFKLDFEDVYVLFEDKQILRVFANGETEDTRLYVDFEETVPDFSNMILKSSFGYADIYPVMFKRFKWISISVFMILLINYSFLQETSFFMAIPVLTCLCFILWLYHDYTLLHILYNKLFVVTLLFALTSLITYPYIDTHPVYKQMIYIWAFPLVFLIIHKGLKTLFRRLYKRNPIITFRREQETSFQDGLYQFLLIALTIGIPALYMALT